VEEELCDCDMAEQKLSPNEKPEPLRLLLLLRSVGHLRGGDSSILFFPGIFVFFLFCFLFFVYEL
jgi:hypothetical protein